MSTNFGPIPITFYWKSGCMRCIEPLKLLESYGVEIDKRNVQRMTREELEHAASLFADDDEMVANLVHERRRELVEGLGRSEIIDRMLEEYTYINRPVAIRGRHIACGPLKFNLERYEREFGADQGLPQNRSR